MAMDHSAGNHSRKRNPLPVSLGKEESSVTQQHTDMSSPRYPSSHHPSSSCVTTTATSLDPPSHRHHSDAMAYLPALAATSPTSSSSSSSYGASNSDDRDDDDMTHQVQALLRQLDAFGSEHHHHNNSNNNHAVQKERRSSRHSSRSSISTPASLPNNNHNHSNNVSKISLSDASLSCMSSPSWHESSSSRPSTSARSLQRRPHTTHDDDNDGMGDNDFDHDDDDDDDASDQARAEAHDLLVVAAGRRHTATPSCHHHDSTIKASMRHRSADRSPREDGRRRDPPATAVVSHPHVENTLRQDESSARLWKDNHHDETTVTSRRMVEQLYADARAERQAARQWATEVRAAVADWVRHVTEAHRHQQTKTDGEPVHAPEPNTEDVSCRNYNETSSLEDNHSAVPPRDDLRVMDERSDTVTNAPTGVAPHQNENAPSSSSSSNPKEAHALYQLVAVQQARILELEEQLRQHQHDTHSIDPESPSLALLTKRLSPIVAAAETTLRNDDAPWNNRHRTLPTSNHHPHSSTRSCPSNHQTPTASTAPVARNRSSRTPRRHHRMVDQDGTPCDIVTYANGAVREVYHGGRRRHCRRRSNHATTTTEERSPTVATQSPTPDPRNHSTIIPQESSVLDDPDVSLVVTRYANGDVQSDTRTESAYYFADTGVIRVVPLFVDDDESVAAPPPTTTTTIQYHYPTGQVEDHFVDGGKVVRFPNGTVQAFAADGSPVSVSLDEGSSESEDHHPHDVSTLV